MPKNLPALLPAESLQMLIAEDDDILREILKDALQAPQRQIHLFADGAQAVQALRQGVFDIVISDLVMSGADGIQVLEEARRCNPDGIVILMTGYGSLDSAIRAIRGGAYEYIRKPFKLEELEIIVNRAAEKISLVRENRWLLQNLKETMAELKDWQRAKDRQAGLTAMDDKISEMDLLLQQIPPDYDLRQKALRDQALLELEKLARLKKEELLDEQEFSAFKKILVKKLTGG